MTNGIRIKSATESGGGIYNEYGYTANPAPLTVILDGSKIFKNTPDDFAP